MTNGGHVDGKGLLVGLAAVVVVLLALMGFALTAGSSDDTGDADCLSQEFC